MEFVHPVNEPMLASYVVREIERWERRYAWGEYNHVVVCTQIVC